ncbi:MAG: hypothetical protein ABR953_11400 [Candidatus Acidiferrales bacterium]|jgi:hypothetical protein
MNSLVKYDAACRALAAASRVDEAKDIRDKAEAIRVYARQAGNRELEQQAIGIRLRAERRTGELLKEAAANGQRDSGKGGNRKSRSSATTVKPATLKDFGITKDQSSKWQQMAAIPAKEFEVRVTSVNGDLTTAAILHPEKVRKFAATLDREPTEHDNGHSHGNTVNGYDLFVLKSVFQKSIRRGLSVALYWSRELVLSKKVTSLWNLLRVIGSEDIGFADPAAAHQIYGLFKAWEKTQNEDLLIYAVVISMQAEKSRLVDDAFNVVKREHIIDEFEKHPLTNGELKELEDDSLTIEDIIDKRPITINKEKTLAALRTSMIKKDEQAALLHAIQLDKCGYGTDLWECLLSFSNPATVSHLQTFYTNYKEMVHGYDKIAHKPYRIFLTHAVMCLIRTAKCVDVCFEVPAIDAAKRIYESHGKKIELVPGGEFDFAFDMHTSWGAVHGRGKRTIEGMRFFYEVGTHLENAANIPNPYAERAKTLAFQIIEKSARVGGAK